MAQKKKKYFIPSLFFFMLVVTKLKTCLHVIMLRIHFGSEVDAMNSSMEKDFFSFKIDMK